MPRDYPAVRACIATRELRDASHLDELRTGARRVYR